MCSKTIHVADFSQWLMTNFLSPVRSAKRGVQLLGAEIFRQPFAIILARHEPCPPNLTTD